MCGLGSFGSWGFGEGGRTSGLACSALTRSGEKLTGDSLIRCQISSYGVEVERMKSHLVKTCCVLEGGGFEEFWPMTSLWDGFKLQDVW